MHRRSLTVFAATLASSQLLLACGGTEATKQKALPVAAAPLETARFTDSVDTITTLESVQVVNLASQSKGRILRLGVREGQVVQKGQMLMQLDQTQQRAALTSAIAKMKSDEKNCRRYEFLASQGAASDQLRDRYCEIYISSAQDVKSKQADLDFNNLQAPITGVISDLLVKQGDVIREGDPFTKIVRNDRLLARIDLPAVRSAQVRRGLRVILLAPDGSRPLAQGTVDFVDPTINPTTQGLLVKSVFANSGGTLRDGQRLRARVELDARDFPSIPFAAVSQSSGQSFVFVVGSFSDLQSLPGQLKKEDIDKLAPPALPSDTRFAMQTPVKLGPLENNRYPVFAGVSPGQQVITSNLLKLRHGTPVQIN